MLEAHRPQRGNDPNFDAYEARLKILLGKPVEAAALLAAAIKNRPHHEQARVSDDFVYDLADFAVAVDVYRCLADKRTGFSRMKFTYRKLERVKEFEGLIVEHAKHHPDDPTLVFERAELHMLRNEFAQAEKEYLLAKTKEGPNATAGASA